MADATKITLAPSSADINLGDSLTLQCHASHDPTMDLTFIWTLDGYPIDLDKPGGHYRRANMVRAEAGEPIAPPPPGWTQDVPLRPQNLTPFPQQHRAWEAQPWIDNYPPLVGSPLHASTRELRTNLDFRHAARLTPCCQSYCPAPSAHDVIHGDHHCLSSVMKSSVVLSGTELSPPSEQRGALSCREVRPGVSWPTPLARATSFDHPASCPPCAEGDGWGSDHTERPAAPRREVHVHGPDGGGQCVQGGHSPGPR